MYVIYAATNAETAIIALCNVINVVLCTAVSEFVSFSESSIKKNTRWMGGKKNKKTVLPAPRDLASLPPRLHPSPCRVTRYYIVMPGHAIIGTCKYNFVY